MLDIIYVRKYLAGTQKAQAKFLDAGGNTGSTHPTLSPPGAAKGDQLVFSHGSIHEGSGSPRVGRE